MGLRKVTYANGSRSSGGKVQRATEAHGFQSWSNISFSTVISSPQTTSLSIVTRGVAASASREAVFNTNELLELLLLHLPIEDILTARHIDQHWNLVIIRSPRIQRSLFRMQAPRYYFWTFDELTEDLRQYKAGDDRRFGQSWAERQNIALPSIINPIFFKDNGLGVKGSLIHRTKYCESMYFKAPPDLKNTDSLVHEMFLCLPAPREVEFKIHYHKKKPRGKGKFFGDDFVRGRVVNKYGVTLADVLERFLQAAEKHSIMESTKDYVICTQSSILWMYGHVFPTAQEFVEVKKVST